MGQAGHPGQREEWQEAQLEVQQEAPLVALQRQYRVIHRQGEHPYQEDRRYRACQRVEHLHQGRQEGR